MSAELNLDVLNKYLQRQQIDIGSITDMQKFSGGQSNPTFKLSSSQGQWVLRRQPFGKLLKSAHAVDREFKVINALANTDVPVPKVIHLCTDSDVIGSQFYIMQYVDGNIYWDASLSRLSESDSSELRQRRANIYNNMQQALVALHSVDLSTAGLLDYGKAGNYFERQLARWTKQYHAAKTQENVDIEYLITWLQQHLPDDDGRVALVHGDFRVDNMIFCPKTDALLAILDWELSTLGHPFADLAYQCMQLRLPHDMGNVPGLGGLDRQALNIPSEQEYVDGYCQKMGIQKIDNWSFYVCFSFFRLLAIVQGVVKRAIDGNASNPQAIALAGLIQPLASLAIDATKN